MAMTLPFENDNMKITKKLAKNSLKSNKNRNIAAIFAIILTTMLLASLFTISTNIATALRMQNIRTMGSDGHVAIKYIDDNIYNELKNDSSIKKISYGMVIADKIGNPELEERQIETWYMDKIGLEFANCVPTVGEIPVAENEILIDTKTLDALGLPHEIGTEVSLKIQRKGNEYQESFILSGYYESDPLLNIGRIFVSEKYKQAHSSELINTYTADGSLAGTVSNYVMFKNAFDLSGKLDSLITEHGYQWSENIQNPKATNIIEASISPAYQSNGIVDDPIMLLSFSVAIAFLVFTGYLLIYNIFQISVIQEIHFYGQLKALGTTRRQLRHYISLQATSLSLVGIPMGILLGYLFGCVLAPMVLKGMEVSSDIKVSNHANPIIFIGAIVFSAITVWISTYKPGKAAANVSPMEALRFNDVSGSTKKEKNSTNGGKIYRMAWSNLWRNRKRTILSVVSMVLGLVLFNTVFIFSQSLDVNKYIAGKLNSDFLVANSNYFSMQYYWKNAGIQDELLTGIEMQNGFEKGGRIYYARPYDGDMNRLEGFSVQSSNPSNYSIHTDGYPRADVYGIEPFIGSNLNVLDGELDFENFETGDYIIQGILDDELTAEFQIGDKISLNYYNEKTNTYETKEYTLLAKVRADYSNTSRVTTGLTFYLPKDEYLSTVQDHSIMSYAFNSTDESEQQFENILTSFGEQTGELQFESKKQLAEEFAGMTQSLTVVGMALSLLVGFVGVVNYANSLITSIIVRKRELSMLQSIGMSGQQLKLLLVLEGLYYVIGTVIGTLILSIIISFGIMRPIINSLTWIQFDFTIAPLLVAYPILLMLAIIIPLATYRTMAKESIVKRLRTE